MNLSKNQLEKLGRDIGYKCNWVGEDILTVFKSALEDANYHSFNETVSKAWKESGHANLEDEL